MIKVGALGLLCAAILASSYLKFGMAVPDGRVVKGEVLRFGTYSAGRVAGGDLPILTVRMPDGSVRDVPATWPDVNNCLPGRWINLVQKGTAVQVGRPGCNATH